jgi:hypothetical protein
LSGIGELFSALEGVRRTGSADRPEWRYHGRLVARLLDDSHLVIRADFDYRDLVLRDFPGTFSVPPRYEKHMMVVADLDCGDAGAIEDAVEAAWLLQCAADRPRPPRTRAPGSAAARQTAERSASSRHVAS